MQLPQLILFCSVDHDCATSLYWFEKPILYLPTVIINILCIQNLNRPSMYEKIYLCCRFLHSQNLVVL